MTDILIVDDAIEISGLLKDFLCRKGFTCTVCETGEAAMEYLKKDTARLVLLDLMLPGMDGFEVCNEIHKNKNLPLIILSARTGKEDKINGLSLGADDYIEKPYDIDLLIAKVKALYRRHYETAGTVLTFDNLTIQREARKVYLNEKEVMLNAKEFDLLLLLAENKGKTLTKEHIFNTIWGYDCFSEPGSLTVHIKWLREKLEVCPKKPTRIVTVWGIGYRFEG